MFQTQNFVNRTKYVLKIIIVEGSRNAWFNRIMAFSQLGYSAEKKLVIILVFFCYCWIAFFSCMAMGLPVYVKTILTSQARLFKFSRMQFLFNLWVLSFNLQVLMLYHWTSLLCYFVCLANWCNRVWSQYIERNKTISMTLYNNSFKKNKYKTNIQSAVVLFLFLIPDMLCFLWTEMSRGW